MKITELKIGMLVNAGGNVAEVTEILTSRKVVVESPENGEEEVSPSYLKPLAHGEVSDSGGDVADQYGYPHQPFYSGGMCEDAPCCGCCG